MKHWTSHSLELKDELFPEPTSRKPGIWKWVIVVLVAFFFVIRSTRPVMRLRQDPPSEFLNGVSHRLQHQQAERQLAEAYWQVAVQTIQSTYPSTKPLPALPPPEFKIGREGVELSSGSEQSRTIYWQQLRRVWDLPEVWVKSFEWNMDWLGSDFASIQKGAQEFVDKLRQEVGSASGM